jgi:FkbM family methyltransferase
MNWFSIGPLANTVLGTLGLELHRKRTEATLALHRPDDVQRLERQSLYGALRHARRLGIRPASVIDVGAAFGTPELYDLFPEARHVLVEPLDTYRPFLEAVVARYPHMEYVIAAATSRPGPVTMHVHADLVGSSMYVETEDSSGLNDTPQSVPGLTLDDLCAERSIPGPYLIKVDVQGAELDVLAGAARVLEQTDYIVLETSLFGFYKHGAQLYDVLRFMCERGLVPYDLVGPAYRPLDGALAQVDVAFVKQDGPLRSVHAYATHAQRTALTQHLLADLPQRPLESAHVPLPNPH